jgi:hypothetical protein
MIKTKKKGYTTKPKPKPKLVYKNQSFAPLKMEANTQLKTLRDYFTFVDIPKSDVFFTMQGVDAREPFRTSSRVERTYGINQPYVLQASELLNKRSQDRQ